MRDAPHRNAFVTLLLLSLALSIWGCPDNRQQAPDGPPLKLSLAVRAAPDSALIAIAQERDFFKTAGLTVSIVIYPSGREALEAVCRNEAQVATMADIAFAAKALEEPTIRVVAAISSNVASQIVARKDRDIKTPADLKGKRVGFSANTTSDYFLYAFLTIENMSLQEITAVDIPPGWQAEAVVRGEVDAVSAFDDYAFAARQRLGSNAISWDCQNNLAYHWLLATRQEVTRSPEVLRRLLRALLAAEAFARSNDAQARQILVRQWGFAPAFIDEIWPKTRAEVTLGQSVVTSLGNFLHWQIHKSGKPRGVPDILEYVHIGALDAVAPHLVTLYR
jgi:NitT/TauT family transport system substrate-binding protein